MSKVDVEEKRRLRLMVEGVWKQQVAMGIAIPKEPLPVALRKRLRRELKKPRR